MKLIVSTVFIKASFLATIMATLAGLVGPGSLREIRPSESDFRLESGFQASYQQTGISGVYLPFVGRAAEPASWVMPGANPQRTSWVPQDVGLQLKPLWYKPFESYIPRKFQIVTADNLLLISTASGLYALDAQSGAQKWSYPTSRPLGNSPTVSEGVVYVAGYDKKLHAVNLATGAGLWTYQAGAGFDTNPLVVGGRVYLGNRDGYFYAIYAQGTQAGQLAWKFRTDGPIHYSAAYQQGVVYFASDDSYAYALDAQDGRLVWKSDKLPGAGFQSWWPVIYGDWVIFSGSNNYRTTIGPGPVKQYTEMERDDVYPNHEADPRGVLVGPLGTAPGAWVNQTPTIDASQPNTTVNGSTYPITEYLEQKPWRRTIFVLNRLTGEEYTSDFDSDGKSEYAPFLWQGTHSGNRFPPIVGGDGVLYQANNYMSDPYIAGGDVTGWEIGTPYVSVISSMWHAVDEPLAYSAAGNTIYWNLCCDRQAGAIDISLPNTDFLDQYTNAATQAQSGAEPVREGLLFSYNVDTLLPGYDSSYYRGTSNALYTAYGGRNGVYGHHGNQSPPIPYKGKLYMLVGNSIVAFAPQAGQVTKLPVAEALDPPAYSGQTPDPNQVRSRLESEVQKMVAAGHLQPGYISSGIFDFRGSRWCGDNLVDYWHSSAETIYTLIRALPYLSPQLQTETRNYLQNEFANYPPYLYNHVGWDTGTSRITFDLPPEVEAGRVSYPALANTNDFKGWKLNPFGFYAMWQYAQLFGGAKGIFDAAKAKLDPLPSDSVFKEMPHVQNAYIAGYWGFLQLEKLAGYPESSAIRNDLDHLLNLRVTAFSKDAPEAYFQDFDLYYCRTLNVARNFIFLVPELAQQMHDQAFTQVEQAVEEYSQVAPYWFVSKYDTTFGEGVTHTIYDSYAMFQAKALILQEPYAELANDLDIPSVAVGDLYYIQNLTAALEAQ